MNSINVLQLLKSDAPWSPPESGFDYIVIGSGAGGGPVASRLARNGFKVLILEAGGSGENKSSQFRYRTAGANARLDPELGWAYWVNSRKNEADRTDQEFYVPGKGLYYPRGTSLGGSTTVNAMISLYPDNEDWNHIADVTGDASWDSLTMRQYFQRVERAGYVEQSSIGKERRSNTGWLSMEQVGVKKNLFKDQNLCNYLIKRIRKEDGGREMESAFTSGGEFSPDPNNWSAVCDRMTGIVDPPRSSDKGVRTGTRELLLNTKLEFPENLTIWTDCLVSRLLFDVENPVKIIGVEFLAGPHLYRASTFADQFENRPTQKHQVHCKREVILCAGAFNSPQILLLSGIGPKQDLDNLGIPCRIDRQGVGKNLQDRLEFGVVCRIPFKPNQYQNCTWGAPGDPCLDEFETGDLNGEYRSRLKRPFYIVKRTSKSEEVPNAIIFGITGSFRGYYDPARSVSNDPNTFTWFTLLGHTKNNAGIVRLKTTDPRDLPEVNFNLFEDDDPQAMKDLEALLDGVKFARRLAAFDEDGAAEWEISPGSDVLTDEELRKYIKREAWGHHASCTNKMGNTSDPMAVVDSRFRVIGSEGLRIVDASIFPRIPGLFIALPIYMASEKAADCIIEDSKKTLNE